MTKEKFGLLKLDVGSPAIHSRTLIPSALEQNEVIPNEHYDHYIVDRTHSIEGEFSKNLYRDFKINLSREKDYYPYALNANHVLPPGTVTKTYFEVLFETVNTKLQEIYGTLFSKLNFKVVYSKPELLRGDIRLQNTLKEAINKQLSSAEYENYDMFEGETSGFHNYIIGEANAAYYQIQNENAISRKTSKNIWVLDFGAFTIDLSVIRITEKQSRSIATESIEAGALKYYETLLNNLKQEGEVKEQYSGLSKSQIKQLDWEMINSIESSIMDADNINNATVNSNYDEIIKSIEEESFNQYLANEKISDVLSTFYGKFKEDSGGTIDLIICTGGFSQYKHMNKFIDTNIVQNASITKDLIIATKMINNASARKVTGLGLAYYFKLNHLAKYGSESEKLFANTSKLLDRSTIVAYLKIGDEYYELKDSFTHNPNANQIFEDTFRSDPISVNKDSIGNRPISFCIFETADRAQLSIEVQDHQYDNEFSNLSYSDKSKINKYILSSPSGKKGSIDIDVKFEHEKSFIIPRIGFVGKKPHSGRKFTERAKYNVDTIVSKSALTQPAPPINQARHRLEYYDIGIGLDFGMSKTTVSLYDPNGLVGDQHFEPPVYLDSRIEMLNHFMVDSDAIDSLEASGIKLLRDLTPEILKELKVNTSDAQFRLLLEAVRSQKAEEEALKKAEEEALKKAEEEALKKAEEEALKKAEEEALKKAEEEALKKAEEEALKKAEEEALKKAKEEALKKAEEEALKKAEEEALKKAEEEALKKAEEEALKKAEEEAKEKAEREAEESSVIDIYNYSTQQYTEYMEGIRAKNQLDAGQMSQDKNEENKTILLKKFYDPQSGYFSNSDLNGSLTGVDLVKEIKNRMGIIGYVIESEMIANLLLCIETGSMTIITGPPGFGKSSLIKTFMHAIGQQNRFCNIQVQRNWNEDSELFGFHNMTHQHFQFPSHDLLPLLLAANSSAQRENYDKLFYALLFDEINLSTPEYYMSSILGAISSPSNSGEIQYVSQFDSKHYNEVLTHPLQLHENTHFFGTANIDDTVERFSPRFLNRVNLIHLNGHDKEFIEGNILNYKTFAPIQVNFKNQFDSKPKQNQSLKEVIGAFTSEGNGKQYFISPRIILGIKQYVELSKKYRLDEETAIDYQILQRLLPLFRGYGPEAKLRLEHIQTVLLNRYKLSAHKIKKMLDYGESHSDYDYFYE